MNLSTEHRDINASLKQIDDLKSTSEVFKVELNTIRENNEKIKKSLETEIYAIDEKINILYTDFHSFIDSIITLFSSLISNVLLIFSSCTAVAKEGDRKNGSKGDLSAV